MGAAGGHCAANERYRALHGERGVGDAALLGTAAVMPALVHSGRSKRAFDFPIVKSCNAIWSTVRETSGHSAGSLIRSNGQNPCILIEKREFPLGVGKMRFRICICIDAKACSR